MTSQTRIGLILAFVVMASAVAMVVSSRPQASAANPLGNVNVTCGPTQRAVIEQAVAGASAPVVNVSCVETASAPVAQHPPAYVAQAPQMTPAAYALPLPTQPTAAPVQMAAYQPQPVVVQQPAPVPVRRMTPRKPSVQKRLLVIGGTAGAGAGIGALVGGRKGALIGAAIGAGGAAAVDQVKHR